MKRKIAVSLILLIVGLMCCACSQTESISFSSPKYEYDITYLKDEDDNSPVVYVTKYGDCYHKFYCSHAKRPYHKLTTKQAIDKGYYACYFCY